MCNFAPNDKQPMNKQDWTYKKLGEVATFINGYPFKPSDWKDSGRKIIRIQNLNNPNAVYNFYDGSIDPKYLVSNGDVLISWSGSLGVFEWTEDEAILNQHIFKVVFNKEYINKKFFQYVVASRINEMKSKVHGVTMQHITKKEFDIILIPVPPIGEQERIVAELDLLQGIIEKKKEQLKAYDQLAQSIFYTMFGDPIDNPKGWEVKKLGEVATQKLSYGSGASAIQYNGKIRYVRITDIREDGDLNSDIVSPDTFDEKYLLNEGDILFARSGATVGKTFQYKSRFGKCIFAGYLIRMIPNIEIVLPSFIFAYTKSSYYRSFVSKAQNAVAQPNINAKQYSDLLVPVPPLSLQQEFAEKVEAIERQKALVQQSIEETQTMFDYTMDKYFG